MENFPQISKAEYEIMKILWSKYPLSTNHIVERAQQSHNWKQKTIHTLLSRLTIKHIISYEQRGRMYYYFPLISQEKYLEQETLLFVDRFYDGKIAPMLSSLLSNKKLSDSDLKDLSEIINSKIENNKR